MSIIGDVPELAAEWLRTRPQFCATCGTLLPEGLPCVACEADGWYAEAVAFHERHKPDAKQANGRWRVDCSCGWRGPLVPLPGHGHGPWVEHFEAAPGYWQDHLGEWHEGEPPWDRCPHGVVGGDVWCQHCDGEPF